MMEADFKVRNNVRVAEPKAIEYLERRRTPYIRYGVDALDSGLPVYKIPHFVRSAPDWIIFNKHDQPLFFEAKGFSGVFKLKLKDIDNYRTWNSYMGLILFLYDVNNGTYCEVMFNEVSRIIVLHQPQIDSYPENINNKFYKIEKKWLPDFTNF